MEREWGRASQVEFACRLSRKKHRVLQVFGRGQENNRRVGDVRHSWYVGESSDLRLSFHFALLRAQWWA